MQKDSQCESDASSAFAEKNMTTSIFSALVRRDWTALQAATQRSSRKHDALETWIYGNRYLKWLSNAFFDCGNVYDYVHVDSYSRLQWSFRATFSYSTNQQELRWVSQLHTHACTHSDRHIHTHTVFNPRHHTWPLSRNCANYKALYWLGRADNLLTYQQTKNVHNINQLITGAKYFSYVYPSTDQIGIRMKCNWDERE